MGIPRMRTIPEAFKELKAADPNTAYTLRAAVNRGEIPVVTVGSKRLINMDLFFARLNSPASNSKDAYAGTGVRKLA